MVPVGLISTTEYAVHQYSAVRCVWGASGVYKFLIFAPPTPPQNLIARILSAHVRCRAAEPPVGGGEGQELEQGSGPPGAAQGNLQGQAGQVQEEEVVTVLWWAVQYFPEEEGGQVAEPYFRLPTQPKVVKGWGGLGEGGKRGKERAAAEEPRPKSQGETPRGAVQVFLTAWTRS